MSSTETLDVQTPWWWSLRDQNV